jgi:ribosomal protein S18 acetylase RimI-like enzyme
MDIRELERTDAAAFWSLRLRGFREDPTAFGRSYEESRGLPLSVAEAILAREGCSADDFVLGAFDGTSLVGIAGFQRDLREKRAHRGTLWGMYVAPEARGMGLARRLVQEVLRRARSVRGLQQLNLTVIAQNEAAVSLYRSEGFEVWGLEKGAMRWGGVDYDEYSMALRW